MIVLLGGLWLWKGGGGLFPTGRELVWQLPDERASIREVEIQLWDGEALLKRESRLYGAGEAQDIVQKVPLRAGEYQARVFIRRDGRAPQSLARTLSVGEEETVVTSLR